MFKHLAVGLGALVLTLLHPLWADAQAAPNSTGISQKVATCDWSYPARCQVIGSDGSAASAAFKGSAGAALPPAADASVPINVATATTTQLVALSAGKKIYVTSFDVVAAGTGNATFVYGTGAACGTGTTSLTGPYNLAAQAGIAKGSGLGAVLVVPAGNALCLTTSAAVQMSGSVAYAQF